MNKPDRTVANKISHEEETSRGTRLKRERILFWVTPDSVIINHYSLTTVCYKKINASEFLKGVFCVSITVFVIVRKLFTCLHVQLRLETEAEVTFGHEVQSLGYSCGIIYRQKMCIDCAILVTKKPPVWYRIFFS